MLGPRSLQIAGYVLAGGASSRFGSDKARAELGGRAMLVRSCVLVAEVTQSVSVVAAAGRYQNIGALVTNDRWPGEGPLGGIITALLATTETNTKAAAVVATEPAVDKAEWNLIVGCDMPFLTGEWLSYLALRALASDAEIVVPKSPQGLEPLCACWRTSAAPVLKMVFDSGVRKVTEAMKRVKMEVVDEMDWKRFDSAGRLFWNMNTAAEYGEAKRMLEAEHL